MFKLNKIIVSFLFLIVVFSPLSGTCQKKTDSEFLFKTWLFLEKENVTRYYDTVAFEKGSSFFTYFQKGIELKLDTLGAKGFSSDYLFLSFDPSVESCISVESGINYRNPNLLVELSVQSGNCSNYILAVNKVKGTSYRLQGFKGNDFISFFQEVQGERKRIFKENLLIKTFLKEYAVEKIDFKCLYNGIKSGEKDQQKYPCLKSCGDILITIGD